MAQETPAAPGAAPEAPAARVLKVHHLRPAPGAKTAKTRVGRGEASKGKTAGRGTKGSKARYQVSAAFEGGQMPLHMRLPKLRGFTSPFRTEHQVVNLDRLAELFPDGGEVGVEDLVAKGAVRRGQTVKVLGTGQISVPVRVTAHAFSASAEERITAAGGSVNLDRLAELFPDGGEVGVEDLVAKGAVRRGQTVKVLGTGQISVPVRVTAHAFSASAEERITAAGGSVTRL